MRKKRKPHEEQKPEDYRDAAENSMEQAKVLAGQGLREHRDWRPGGLRLRGPGAGLGGLVFEDTKAETLAEAMAALEKELEKWFQEQGIKVEPADRRQE